MTQQQSLVSCFSWHRPLMDINIVLIQNAWLASEPDPNKKRMSDCVSAVLIYPTESSMLMAVYFDARCSVHAVLALDASNLFPGYRWRLFLAGARQIMHSQDRTENISTRKSRCKNDNKNQIALKKLRILNCNVRGLNICS